MKSQRLLNDYIKMAEIHAIKLKGALDEATNMQSSLTSSLLPKLVLSQVAFLDMLNLRFSKLQDLIGSKIFPITLDLLKEDALTFIDKLNKLERLGFLTGHFNANWWLSLREIRNQLSHDYPDDYELIASHLSILLVKATELLDFWKFFKEKHSQHLKDL